MKIIRTRNYRAAADAAYGTIAGHGIAAMPTDTAYGLSGLLEDSVIRRIFKIKGRPKDKPIPVIADSFEMVSRMAVLDKSVTDSLAKLWPGPLSVILQKKEGVSELLTAGTGKIMVRIPDDDFILMVLRKLAKPITSTSANVSGNPPIFNGDMLEKEFAGAEDTPDLVLNCGTLRLGAVSTIIDLSLGGMPELVRGGAYPNDKIESAFGVHFSGVLL
jgi:L-threonylcarbamoyladenylate synthase